MVTDTYTVPYTQHCALAYAVIRLHTAVLCSELTAVSYKRVLPLANYCKSEEILFKSDTKHDLLVNSSNFCTEDNQVCKKKFQLLILKEQKVSDINVNQ